MAVKTIPERFWSRVYRDGPSDLWPHECWPWLGSLTSDGYGICRYEFGSSGAHKAAYLIAKGKIAHRWLCVRHSCDFRACCNPTHLVLGTYADNARDKRERKRPRGVFYRDDPRHNDLLRLKSGIAVMVGCP